ncbi:MAG: hypothetical protein WAL88_01110 [Nitrosotalea sp.]
MKANFTIKKNNDVQSSVNIPSLDEKKNLTQEEFEDFIIKSGAKGSFMVYRSGKKDDELGLEQL